MKKLRLIFGLLMVLFSVFAFSETVITVGVFTWDVPIFEKNH